MIFLTILTAFLLFLKRETCEHDFEPFFNGKKIVYKCLYCGKIVDKIEKKDFTFYDKDLNGWFYVLKKPKNKRRCKSWRN